MYKFEEFHNAYEAIMDAVYDYMEMHDTISSSDFIAYIIPKSTSVECTIFNTLSKSYRVISISSQDISLR